MERESNMLRLKEANWQDIEKEYQFITTTPENENGFTNSDYGCSFEEFKEHILPKYMNESKGIGLEEGRVPCTQYFLWYGDQIVGLFRLRHYLNDTLARGAGHIGFTVGKKYRQKGYGKLGLQLLVEKAWPMIREDEIYMSCLKTNIGSLKTQQACGAYIHHEDDLEYYTRIKKPH